MYVTLTGVGCLVDIAIPTAVEQLVCPTYRGTPGVLVSDNLRLDRHLSHGLLLQALLHNVILISSPFVHVFRCRVVSRFRGRRGTALQTRPVQV